MNFAYYIKKTDLLTDRRVVNLLKSLADLEIELYQVNRAEELSSGTDLLLSLGGDGTFLSAAEIAIKADVPILGVNFGRLGFLSGATSNEFLEMIQNESFIIQERDLLEIQSDNHSIRDIYPYALNEISVSRVSASMLGVDVCLDGVSLPTYWADGLLVATSSGSTAYSLSVGGPICMPESKVFILSPISPHNLNLRPLVLPPSSVLEIALQSRDEVATLSLDNRHFTIPINSTLKISAAKKKLRCMKSRNISFINALQSRLYWGEDIRNN